MWGICFDILADRGKLFQRAIEYENSSDQSRAEISVDEIKPAEKPPAFAYGELVSPVGQPDIIGRIEDIIWHFKNNEYNYYISVNGRKKSKRYYSDELSKL